VAPDPRLRAPDQVEEAISVDRHFLDFQTAIVGRYSLERELGRGGMGIVYLAREVSLDRSVAIKLLPPGLAAQPELRERFLREARTAAQLSQPNIVPIHTVDEVGGFVFFVMAFIDGETLGERVRTQGPLSPQDTARILREIAWALSYAHAQGVIHRDLKPDNIILERATGRAVLTDFGIARRLEASGLTAGGELIGTPEYMSPEQATGGALDGRTDLYSLGIVGFYALTGRLPFESATIPALLVQHATAPAPPLAPLAPGAPRALTQAVTRCLEKSPGARFDDAKGFADALSMALEARREIPAPVRAFVKDSLELRPSGCLYVMMVSWFAPLLMSRMFTTGAFGVLPYVAFLAAAFIGLPLLAHLNRIRRLVRAGYGVDDVLAGAQAEMDRKREELAFTAGRDAAPVERLLARLRWPALAVAVGSVLAAAVNLLPGFSSPVVPMIAVGAVGLWAVGSVVDQRRRDVTGERRLKYWSSRFGRWLFKVAGAGLSPRVSGAGATHRPTELALAFAAEDLYADLPPAIRGALPGLPDVLKRLEQQARTVRARIEELEQSLVEVAQGAAPAAAPAHRDKLVADLTASRDLARTRLSQTVAALETIRLDLLRLRAGAGSVDRITADLAAAGQIGETVDRLLAAGDEVDKALWR
jgi:eukaryotic-like serine/threonine-protein kinase